MRFSDLFPISLSGLPYNQQANDTDYLTATVTFNYKIYDFASTNVVEHLLNLINIDFLVSLCYIEYIMDLEQLQELAEKDLKINDTELDLESLKTPQIHNI